MSGSSPRNAPRWDITTTGEGIGVYVGIAAYDVLLGDVHTLKAKRGAVRPLVAELRRRFEVAVAETGHGGLYRRTELGVAVVSGEPARCTEVLDRIDRWWDERPEVELLAIKRRLRSIEDE